MSAIFSIFDKPQMKLPEQPKAPPPAPTISDAAIEAADREARARLRQRKGFDQAFLSKGTAGLGDVAAPSGGVARATLLGGAGVV